MLDDDLGLTGDEEVGVSIVRKALVEPLRWIAQNAGHDGYVVVGKVAASSSSGTASTRPPASTSTWSSPASSTR